MNLEKLKEANIKNPELVLQFLDCKEKIAKCDAATKDLEEQKVKLSKQADEIYASVKEIGQKITEVRKQHNYVELRQTFVALSKAVGKQARKAVHSLVAESGSYEGEGNDTK